MKTGDIKDIRCIGKAAGDSGDTRPCILVRDLLSSGSEPKTLGTKRRRGRICESTSSTDSAEDREESGDTRGSSEGFEGRRDVSFVNGNITSGCKSRLNALLGLFSRACRKPS